MPSKLIILPQNPFKYKPKRFNQKHAKPEKFCLAFNFVWVDVCVIANSLVAFLMGPKTRMAIVRKRSNRTNGKAIPMIPQLPFPQNRELIPAETCKFMDKAIPNSTLNSVEKFKNCICFRFRNGDYPHTNMQLEEYKFLKEGHIPTNQNLI